MLKAYPLNCLCAAVFGALSLSLCVPSAGAADRYYPDGINLERDFGTLEYDAGSGSNIANLVGTRLNGVMVGSQATGSLTIRAGMNNEFKTGSDAVEIISSKPVDAAFIAGGDNIVSASGGRSTLYLLDSDLRFRMQAGGSNVITNGGAVAAVWVMGAESYIELIAGKDNIITGGDFGFFGNFQNDRGTPGLLIAAGGKNEFSGLYDGFFAGGLSLQIVRGRENVFRGRNGLRVTGIDFCFEITAEDGNTFIGDRTGLDLGENRYAVYTSTALSSLTLEAKSGSNRMIGGHGEDAVAGYESDGWADVRIKAGQDNVAEGKLAGVISGPVLEMESERFQKDLSNRTEMIAEHGRNIIRGDGDGVIARSRKFIDAGAISMVESEEWKQFDSGSGTAELLLSAPEGGNELTGGNAGIDVSAAGLWYASYTVDDSQALAPEVVAPYLPEYSDSKPLTAQARIETDSGVNRIEGGTAGIRTRTFGWLSRDSSASLSVEANSGTNEITGGETGIEAYGRADVTVSSLTGRSIISGGSLAISVSDGASVSVSGESAVTGGISAEGKGSAAELRYAGQSTLAGDIASSDGASVRLAPREAGAAVYFEGSAQAASAGTIDIGLEGEASRWRMTASSRATSLSGSGTVEFANGGDSLQLDSIEGTGTLVMDLSVDGQESDMLYAASGSGEVHAVSVKNAEALARSMKTGEAVRFASYGTGAASFSAAERLAWTEGASRTRLVIEERASQADPLNTAAYNDAYNGDGTRKPTSAEVAETYGGMNAYFVKTVEENDAGRAAASESTLLWRYLSDIDTYTKRMAQSAEFVPGAGSGAWLRTRYGRLRAEGEGRLHGPTWTLGFTGDLTRRADFAERLGFSAGYSVQSGSFSQADGSLRLKDAQAALYYTRLFYGEGDTAQRYWDNVLRGHRISSRKDVTDSVTRDAFRGTHDQAAVSLSTEYGERVALTDTISVTPQSQFRLMWLEGFGTVDSRGMKASAGDAWSAVLRVGADAEKRFGERGTAYLKASLLHEFSRGQSVTVSGTEESSPRWVHRGGERGTWGVLGAGLSLRTGRSTFVWLDGEAALGNGRSGTCAFIGGLRSAF